MKVIEKDLLKELTKRNAIAWKSNYITILGTINLTLFPARAWAITLQNIGIKKGGEYIYNLGKIYGESAFKILNDKMKGLSSNISEDYLSFLAFLEVAGIGKVKKFDEKKLEVEFDEHFALNYSYELYSKSAFTPFFYAGVLTAFYNGFHRKKARFKFKIKKEKFVFLI